MIARMRMSMRMKGTRKAGLQDEHINIPNNISLPLSSHYAMR